MEHHKRGNFPLGKISSSFIIIVYLHLQQQQHFFSFLQRLQYIRIRVKINSNPKITANTIIAGKATKITNANAAPINRPITKDKLMAKITATIPKHFTLLAHLSHSFLWLS